MANRTIFMISPIGATGTVEHRRYRQTLDYIVKKAFPIAEWDVIRADDEASPDSITTQVIGRIVNSDLIIADLSDHNPNVFYELAVAHGYQKPVIHLMQTGQKVPFDVVDQRVIFYDLTDPESVDKAQRGLHEAAAWLDANPGQSRNPLSSYGQFSAISSATESGDGGPALAQILETLTRQISRLEWNHDPFATADGFVSQTRQRIANLRGEQDYCREKLAALELNRAQILASIKPGVDEHEVDERLDKIEREILSFQHHVARLEIEISSIV